MKSFKLILFEKIVVKCTNYIDRLRGLDFLTVIQSEDVGLDPKLSHWSSPSGDKNLKSLFTDMNITEKDLIIDVGCGKGSAMRTMLKFPFERVDGIEISDIIVTIAKRNFKRLKKIRGNVFNANALFFNEYDGYNFVYFYNPFPEIVMKQVITFLIESIQRSDRELIIIYNNSKCSDVIINNTIFKKIGFYPSRNKNKISIYSNFTITKSRLKMNKLMYS
jgi:SAM-dependent methyltransferase